jgi:carbonic anhydrase
MSATEDLVANSEGYAAHFPGPLPAAPSRRVAVVTCMDARIDVYRLLGLAEGEAHVVRNAGAIVTDDVLRSLAISQRVLGTREIMLVRHTECGLLGFPAEEFDAGIETETGVRPPWKPATLTDLDDDLRRAIAGIRADPILPHAAAVRGFVYDVAAGRLREVDGDELAA